MENGKKQKQRSSNTDIAEFIPRIITDLVLLLIIYTIIYYIFLSPVFPFSDEQIPGLAVSWKSLAIFASLLFVLLLSERLIKDVKNSLETLIKYLVKILPGITKGERSSLKRVLQDVAYVLVLILIAIPVTPALSDIAVLGPQIAFLFSLLIVGVIILLIYDTARISSDLLKKKIEILEANLKSKSKPQVKKR